MHPSVPEPQLQHLAQSRALNNRCLVFMRYCCKLKQRHPCWVPSAEVLPARLLARQLHMSKLTCHLYKQGNRCVGYAWYG